MPDNDPQGRSNNTYLGYFIWALLAWLLVYRVARLDDVIYIVHNWRQSDTVMMIDAYYRYGVDLLRPMLGWKGSYRIHAFEFPVTQGLVAGLYPMLGAHLAIAKALYLIFFLAGVWYLYRLVQLFGGTKEWALWTALVYMAVPLSLYYSVALQVDYLTITAGLGGLHALIRYRQTDRLLWLLPFGLWLLLAGLEKPPYLVAVLPLYALVALRGASVKHLAWAAAAAVPAAVATVWWMDYSSWLNGQAPDFSFIPGFDRGDKMAGWYFGTLAQRTDGGNYLMLLTRGLAEFTFPACAAGAAGLALILSEPRAGRASAWVWLWLALGVGVMVMTIFNLNLHHDYYQTPVTMLVAVFAGYALAQAQRRSAWLAGALALIITANGVRVANVDYFKHDIGIEEAGALIAQGTRPEELLLFVNQYGNWPNPLLSAYARRYGFNIPPPDVTPARLDSVQAHGVHTLVSVNQSPAFPPEVQQKLALRAHLVGPLGTRVDVYQIR